MEESTIESKFCVFCNDWHTPLECRGKIVFNARQQRRRDLFEKVALAMLHGGYHLDVVARSEKNPMLIAKGLFSVVGFYTEELLESADKFSEGKE